MRTFAMLRGINAWCSLDYTYVLEPRGTVLLKPPIK
jgi:hypothetical protein